jgi:ubiquinone/menaquinone biosynthesis C-methylase UbiE
VYASNPMQRLADRPERLDGPLDDPAVLRENLRDMRRVNRWLGGTALSRSALIALATGFHHDPRVGRTDWRQRPLMLLDVGTGSADIPVTLVEWTDAHGLQLIVEAIDVRHEIIDVAHEIAASTPAVMLQVAEGPPLPYPDAAFDVAHASMVTHHLEPDELSVFLVEMRRVSRVGVIINDLQRGWRYWILSLLLSRSFTRNTMTRYDGPLSVRRAYRAAELAQAAAVAGLIEVARFQGFVGHRYALAFVPTVVADMHQVAPGASGAASADEPMP